MLSAVGDIPQAEVQEEPAEHTGEQPHGRTPSRCVSAHRHLAAISIWGGYGIHPCTVVPKGLEQTQRFLQRLYLSIIFLDIYVQ